MVVVEDYWIRVICDHVAVQLDHYILVFGGVYNDKFGPRIIWMFNLYTETWRKHVIPRNITVPPTKRGASAVVIGPAIYMFGGIYSKSISRGRALFRGTLMHGHDVSNAVWQLRRKPEGHFVWDQIKSKRNVVSPRCWHSGWEYRGKLWVFGGKGEYRPTRFLNDNGDFTAFNEDYVNNQLLCFDPSCQAWDNPKCFGDIPEPRRSHATSTVGAKTWLFGGIGERNNAFDDLFELDMDSLTWTKILTGQPKPSKLYACTLTPLSDDKLILHGGYYRIHRGKTVHDTWILDLPSMTWRIYDTGLQGPQRTRHTCTKGINGQVIIIGGQRAEINEVGSRYYHCYIYKHCHIVLEPKSLQQLATQTIHKNRESLSWQTLPRKLVSLLNF